MSEPTHSLPKEENAAPEHGIQVSIVVACRNEIEHVHSFLDSLLGQEFPGVRWEAIIADGLSDDGTREILDQYSRRHPQVRVITNPARIVSAGLNGAIVASRGEIIIRMDSHTRYAPDYCRLCVETLKDTGADNVGGPARTNATGTYARAVAAAYHSPFCTGAKFHDINYEGWVDTVTYGCWYRATFERIGLFDESLVRNQDDEFNLRLSRAGGKIWQNPRIISWYSPRTTLTGVFLQYFQYGFWKVAVVRKHKIPGSWRHSVPVLFVLANLFLLATVAVAGMMGNPHLAFTAASAFTLLLSAYAIANLFASVAAATRAGWDLFPFLPGAFATFHFSWGLGFLVGLLRLRAETGRPLTLAVDSTFTRLTR